MAVNIFEELKWRGMVYDSTEGAQELLATQKVTLYNGFDVTADSLHVGHMVPLIALARMQRFGHHPIALAGGGTTMVGDPSGKSTERQLMTREAIEYNASCIKKQLAHFLDFEVKGNPARLMNNADWLLSLNLIDFLRDIGKHFTVNAMLAKDSVRTRLEREEGLSFTEFSYQLMQSYDFLHLYRTENCVMQTGGSDQWGNITAGTDLIRRVTGKAAYALVYPLITKADGSKFGKTESGSVWLSAERTSPYRFYQFWLNTNDSEVINYLKYFTFQDEQRVADLALAVQQRPEQREAQRVLAREMTATMHGETALARAEQAAQVLFGGELTGLTAADVEDIFADVPSGMLPKSQLEGAGAPLLDVLVTSGLSTSKGDARRSVAEGGIYLNNARVNDPARSLTLTDLIDGQFVLLRKGKKSYHLLKVGS